MALALALLAIPALAANAAQDTATRSFEKTLTLGANQTLAMEHKFGEVHIHGENSREVKISATIRVQATTQAEAEHNADQIKIEVSQDAEGIKVRTVYPDQHAWYIRVGKGPSYSVDYDIAVPSDAKLWLRNNFGNVEVRNVRGWADIENGHGKLELRDSGAAKLTNSFGQVDVNGADGNLTVVNNNGAVTVSTSEGHSGRERPLCSHNRKQRSRCGQRLWRERRCGNQRCGSFNGEQFLWQRECAATSMAI